MDELKKQAEELGIKVDGRWSAERLQAEIDEKLAADPEPEPQRDVDPIPETPAVDPAVETPAEELVPVDEPEAPDDPVEPEPEPEPEPEVETAKSTTITSLIENPMRAFGLTGKGSSVVLTSAQLNDDVFVAKLERAVDLGFIKGE